MKPGHAFLFPLFLILTNIKYIRCGFFDIPYNLGAKVACSFMEECCNENSIPGDLLKLRRTLQANVFGQHIAIDLVINAISGHWNSPHARKPLTMSFHGYTGSGKNYVSQIIAESLYKRGMQSNHVHLFSPMINFPEIKEVPLYQKKLYQKIKDSVIKCPKQLFIFDEIENMPPGVLDGIKAIIDYHENVESVDYRQCIFIFLSNTGAIAIKKQFLNLWRSGTKREDIKLADFETLVSQGAFNEEGGFFRAEAIKNNLIDHYVPFLPMERDHVEMCIALEFKIRGIHFVEQEVNDDVINFIEWGPLPENKFSKTGCKRLSQKVASIAAQLKRNSKKEL